MQNISKLKKQLTPEQYRVTQENGTEPPFQNAYWNNHEKGIYVDIISGEVLFLSQDKFDSGTGWPSFSKPFIDTHITEYTDTSLYPPRTEVRSKQANSHLGHVFNDGLVGTSGKMGLRYCINSAALRFISIEEMEAEGYGEYKNHIK